MINIIKEDFAPFSLMEFILIKHIDIMYIEYSHVLWMMLSVEIYDKKSKKIQ